MSSTSPEFAYFSMEIGLETGMPTYAGGLGILAGDFLRSAADRELRMVGLTLLHRRGYFVQRLDEPLGEVRAHLDLAASDVGAETARHEALGARVVATFDEWTVLTDPTGAAYCITGRMPA